MLSKQNSRIYSIFSATILIKQVSAIQIVNAREHLKNKKAGQCPAFLTVLLKTYPRQSVTTINKTGTAIYMIGE
jgi:hypothetical protein